MRARDECLPPKKKIHIYNIKKNERTPGAEFTLWLFRLVKRVEWCGRKSFSVKQTPYLWVHVQTLISFTAGGYVEGGRSSTAAAALCLNNFDDFNKICMRIMALLIAALLPRGRY